MFKRSALYCCLIVICSFLIAIPDASSQTRKPGFRIKKSHTVFKLLADSGETITCVKKGRKYLAGRKKRRRFIPKMNALKKLRENIKRASGKKKKRLKKKFKKKRALFRAYNSTCKDGRFAGHPESLTRYRNELNEDEVRHVLGRFALGGTPELINIGVTQGLDALVNALLNYQAPAGLHSEAMQLATAYARVRSSSEIAASQLPISDLNRVRWTFLWTADSVTQYWSRHLRYGNPLLERMKLFWHEHFATDINVSADIVINDRIFDHLDMLERNALGSFPNFIKELHHDVAMNVWLGNNDNTWQRPNENYGRELLELFTMGTVDPIFKYANYTEEDVIQGSTRAVSGVRLRTHYHPMRRDWQGNNYPNPNATGCDVDDIDDAPLACDVPWSEIYWDANRWMEGGEEDPDPIPIFLGTVDQRNTTFKIKPGQDNFSEFITTGPDASARYITAKLFSVFVHPEPSEVVVNELSRVFAESGYNIKAVVLKLIKSSAMFSNASRSGCILSPSESFYGLFRNLNLPLATIYDSSDALDIPQENRSRWDNPAKIDLMLQLALGYSSHVPLRPLSVFGPEGCGVNRDGNINHGEGWNIPGTLLERQAGLARILNEINNYFEHTGQKWSSLVPANLRLSPSAIIDHLAHKMGIKLNNTQKNIALEYMHTARYANYVDGEIVGYHYRDIIWDPNHEDFDAAGFEDMLALKIGGLIDILFMMPDALVK